MGIKKITRTKVRIYATPSSVYAVVRYYHFGRDEVPFLFLFYEYIPYLSNSQEESESLG